MTDESRHPNPAFWEEAAQVEKFAARGPDHRLLALLESYDAPCQTRVLDVGCAGGRNTVLLAELGFDVHAIDRAAAMVQRTRERLTPLIGAAQARERVCHGVMDDLARFADGSVQLVVALGVYHQAHSPSEWRRALSEAQRVLAPDGLVLVSVFSPQSQPLGVPLGPVAGEPHMYDGFPSGPLHLVEAEELDRAMASHGLVGEGPTETVFVPMDVGHRVTVNGLYRKRSVSLRPGGPGSRRG